MPVSRTDIQPELKIALTRGINALADLPTNAGALFDRYDRKPQPGSKASSECEEIPDIEAPMTAHSQGARLISHTGSHMWLLHRGLTDPILPIACWTALRGVLEAGAWAAWLLDPSLSARDRIERSMNIRLRDLRAQATWMRAATTSGSKEHQIEREALMMEVAQELGIEAIRSAKGNLIGFGETGIPSTTSVVSKSFEERHMYQLLSAMAHGRSWAAQTMSFSPLDEKDTMTESLDPQRILFIIFHAMTWFANPAWNFVTLNGWDMDEFIGNLEQSYTEAGLAESARFWR